MTLKEKFYKEIKFIERAEICEQIADDYAIEFAEWLDNKYYQGENFNEYREGKYFTAKQLLEIFKKEKGL
jgi:hypothetical protein